MPKLRPYVLSIAGFDPSGGAGLNADIKVFQAHKTVDLSVCTGITIQDEDHFEDVNWSEQDLILAQLQILIKRYPIKYCKVGLIENISVLKKVLDLLSENEIKIIWDPILKSSSGFNFGHDIDALKEILPKLFLLTPNWLEFEAIFGYPFNSKNTPNYPCHIYLKGGHNEEAKGKDYLITSKVTAINPKKGDYWEKHGSGCILSAAITANLAKGFPLLKACLKAKRHVEKALNSNKTKLAWH